MNDQSFMTAYEVTLSGTEGPKLLCLPIVDLPITVDAE